MWQGGCVLPAGEERCSGRFVCSLDWAARVLDSLPTKVEKFCLCCFDRMRRIAGRRGSFLSKNKATDRGKHSATAAAK